MMRFFFYKFITENLLAIKHLLLLYKVKHSIAIFKCIDIFLHTYSSISEIKGCYVNPFQHLHLSDQNTGVACNL